MKFTVNSIELKKALDKLKPAILSNPILPILENVKIEDIGDAVHFTTSSMAITAETFINSEVEHSKVLSFCICFQDAYDFISKCSNENIFIETNGVFCAITSKMNGCVKIAVESSVDYPKTIGIDSKFSVSLTKDQIYAIKKQVSEFCGTDELKAYMMGVCFSFDGDLTCISSDGHTLSKLIIPGDYEKGSYIVTKSLLLALESNIEGDCKLEFSDSNVLAVTNNVNYIGRLIDERFPDTSNHTPKTLVNKTCDFDRSDLISVISLASRFGNKVNKQVNIDFANGSVLIWSEDKDFDSQFENKTITFDNPDLEGFKISANGEKLIKALKAHSGDTIEMGVKNNNTPIIFSNSESYFNLVMPVMR